MNPRWMSWAISMIQSDFQRSADTHLLKISVPYFENHDIHLYLKDESTHPTGGLKHRLARSLFLYGLSNGWIKEGTTIVEASSGSTAISEAYFSKLVGLKFIAVIPSTTAQRKIDEIKFWGGDCHLVENCGDLYSQAQDLANDLNGHYMDQFTFAERATDWRGNNNIAESIFTQMKNEKYACPDYIVVGAGTGGTSATIGRYINYFPQCPKKKTKLVVADPTHSVFYDYFQTRDSGLTIDRASGIEGIGRPRVEPSFIADVVDEVIQVENSDSLATAHVLVDVLGKLPGASTGTNVHACFELMERMIKEGKTGSVVSLLCDSGNRYTDTYFNKTWLSQNGYVLENSIERIQKHYF